MILLSQSSKCWANRHMLLFFDLSFAFKKHGKWVSPTWPFVWFIEYFHNSVQFSIKIFGLEKLFPLNLSIKSVVHTIEEMRMSYMGTLIVFLDRLCLFVFTFLMFWKFALQKCVLQFLKSFTLLEILHRNSH